MLFISRRYLCIYRSNEKLDVVEKRNLRELLEARPSNTIYFETADNKLYGMISYGDIRKARDGIVRINNSFVSLERDAYMEARERFRRSNSICEIPVVKNGQLVGEFHKFDDELMIDRAVDLDNNAYAPAYFARLRNVAIVKPPASRDYKMRYFEKLKRIFDHYAVAYTVLEVSDIAQNLTRFDRFFVVDEQERRGVHIIISLFEDKQHFFYKIVTFLRMLNRIESDEAIDYKKLFSELEKRGVETVLMTTKRNDSNYVVKTEKEMKERFPTVANNLNELMVQYEQQFFDDLYEKTYAREIEACHFSIQRVRDGIRLKDIKSELVNVEHGERATVDQPDDYERCIYFFGQCLIIGAYVDDAHTIESYLQAMVNEAGYKARIVNCGCWGNAIQSVVRMLATPLREGDIVVMLSEDPDVDTTNLKTVDLWQTLEKNGAPSQWMLDIPFHANHHVSELCAKALFDVIFDSRYKDKPRSTEVITQGFDIVDQFFTQNYFHGQDLRRFNRVACCVFNGNPFTNGHKYLIETASKAVDHVYLLSLRENCSMFSFNERYAMAVDATSNLPNVTVVPDSLSVADATNFPAYFIKVYEGDAEEQIERHVEMYAAIAKPLHTTHRYVGEEAHDLVANGINEACKRILPRYGIKTVVVKRKEDDSGVITGSCVRELAANNNPRLDSLVPKATANIIRCKEINAF